MLLLLLVALARAFATFGTPTSLVVVVASPTEVVIAVETSDRDRCSLARDANGEYLDDLCAVYVSREADGSLVVETGT